MTHLQESHQSLHKTYTICGAGIAGLYTAYKILLKDPNAKVTILDKNKYIGGRVNVTQFANTQVPIGAGIGRKAKDHLLIELLDGFKLKYGEGHTSSQHIGHASVDLKEIIHKLRDAYKHTPYHEPFKKFALRHMPLEEYNNFVINTGYSDYNNTDAYDVLYNYGLEDALDGWKTMYVGWNDLISALVEFIKSKGGKIKLGYTVHTFKGNRLYYTKTNHNAPSNALSKSVHISDKHICVFATTIYNLRSILHSYEIYKSISATPFMRIYGQFSKTTRGFMATYISKTTLLNKPVQEIIPINPTQGVYMIVYNDNGSAVQMHKKLSELNNTSTAITSNNLGPYVPKYNTACKTYIEDLLASALELPRHVIKLNKISVYFWHEGTHYFKPLSTKYANRNEFIKDAQRPCKNVYVVGEVVAQHQGWTEGALKSVVNVIDEIID